MSVSSITSSNVFQPPQQADFKAVRKDFQQLGKDLKAGDLEKAKSDFATLTKDAQGIAPKGGSFGQDVSSLAQALQGGDLAAAQQDYSKIQQAVQRAKHGHRGRQSDDSDGDNDKSSLAQDFGSLGQALKSGNASAAQQAYAAVQKDLEQFGIATGNSASADSQAAGESAASNVRASA